MNYLWVFNAPWKCTASNAFFFFGSSFAFYISLYVLFCLLSLVRIPIFLMFFAHFLLLKLKTWKYSALVKCDDNNRKEKEMGAKKRQQILSQLVYLLLLCVQRISWKCTELDYCLFIHSSITYALFIDILQFVNYLFPFLYRKQRNAQNKIMVFIQLKMSIYKNLLITT